MARTLYLGIDVSTLRQAEQGHTVAACLEDSGGVLRLRSLWPLATDEALLALLRWDEPLWIGVDAPLSLPPCLACQGESCPCPSLPWFRRLGESDTSPYHYRLSDLVVRKTLPGLHPKPPLSTGGPVDLTPLTMRWLRLTRLCRQEGVSLARVIEVFSSGAGQIFAHFFGLSAGKPWSLRKTSEGRQGLLSALSAHLPLLPPDEDIHLALCRYPDAFDAFLAALTSWHVAQGRILWPTILLGLEPSLPPFARPLPSLSSEDATDLAARLSPETWLFLPNPWALASPSA